MLKQACQFLHIRQEIEFFYRKYIHRYLEYYKREIVANAKMSVDSHRETVFIVMDS